MANGICAHSSTMGRRLGSQQNEEARIDSLPQSWSVISGAGDSDRALQAMRSVEEHLIRRKEKLVLLFTPPFDHSTPHPGYIMGYPPGCARTAGNIRTRRCGLRWPWREWETADAPWRFCRC